MDLTSKPTQTKLTLVTNQLKEQMSSQLTIRRQRLMGQTCRFRPTMIMSDKTIFHYLEKHLTVINDFVYFKGEANYEPQLWATETPDQCRKIINFVIERHCVR